MRRITPAFALLLIALPAPGQDYAGPPGLTAFDTPTAPADAAVGGPYPAERLWVRAQYVAWGATTREAIERAEDSTASRLFEGVLGLTGTSREDITRAGFEGRYGFRLAAGLWADPEATIGAEAAVMYLDRRPLEAPPVTGADLARLGALSGGVILPGLGGGGGGTVVVPVTAGNLAAGTLRFELGDQTFLDLQALGRAYLGGTPTTRLDGLVGARYLSFEERLGVAAQMTALAPPLFVGSTVTAGARVESRTTYCGPLVGFEWLTTHGWWEFAVRPTVTIARVENRISRQAFARATVPGAGTMDLVPVALFPGGLGRATDSDWTAVPEIDLRVAYRVFSNVRLVGGAGLIVMPGMVRATGQLDPGLPVQAITPGVSGIPLAGIALTPDRETMYLGTLSLGLEIWF